MNIDKIRGSAGRSDADPDRTLTNGEMNDAGFLAIVGISRVQGTMTGFERDQAVERIGRGRAQ